MPHAPHRWEPGHDPVTPEEIQAFFESPPLEALKRRMCDIGRRLWEKDFVDGNGGNLSVRVGDDLVLCTPTLMSKGFMQPGDLCLVDLEGRQLAGNRRRTSEITTHLSLLRRQSRAMACVHAHPPHATAWAVVDGPLPPPLLTEAEIFLGELGRAGYHPPGSPEIADAVGVLASTHQCILMENHGVITWSHELEDAYWKVEIVEAYCKTAAIASRLDRPLRSLNSAERRVLQAIRRRLDGEAT